MAGCCNRFGHRLNEIGTGNVCPLRTAEPQKGDQRTDLPPPGEGKSAATFELRILVGGDERPQLLHSKLRVAGIDQMFRRELRPCEAVLDEPILHVEHAGDVDAAVRAARRPRIFVEQFRPSLRAVPDQRRDDLVLDGRPMIGIAIVMGFGLTRSSGAAKPTAWPCSTNCDTNGGITMPAS